MDWSKEKHNYLVQLKNKNLGWTDIAVEMTRKFDEPFRREQCRSRWRNNRHLIKSDPKKKYRTAKTKNDDGSYEIDQLIELTEDELLDDKHILKAHGYDPDKWDVTSHQYSEWDHHNKQDGTIKLYASKIKMAPKANGIDWDELIHALENRSSKDPIPFKGNMPHEPTYLEIPLFDMHFGIADIDYYYPTLQKNIRIAPGVIQRSINNSWTGPNTQ